MLPVGSSMIVGGGGGRALARQIRFEARRYGLLPKDTKKLLDVVSHAPTDVMFEIRGVYAVGTDGGQ
jgi:hypothetical protein